MDGCAERRIFKRVLQGKVEMNEKQHFIDDMKIHRGIDFAQIGMMVKVGDDIGTIVGMNSSANLDVIFANQLKYGKVKYNCHPTSNITYFGKDGEIVKDYRGKD